MTQGKRVIQEKNLRAKWRPAILRLILGAGVTPAARRAGDYSVIGDPTALVPVRRVGSALWKFIGVPETGWRKVSSHEWSARRCAVSVVAPYLRSPTIG